MAVRTRRQYLGIGAALGAGLLAAACDIVPAGTPQAPQEAQDRPVAPKRPDPGLPRQTQRQVPIRVRYSTGGAYGAAWNASYFRQYTAPFTEAHPHLSIEWQDWYDVPDLRQGFREAVATGQAGDVMHDLVHLPWWVGDAVPNLVTQGALLGLDQYIRRDSYDLTDFWPGCLVQSTWRGDLYALQTHVDTQLVFYNQGLLGMAGVSAPASDWTWQHLLDRARALTGHRGGKPVYGFAISHSYGWPLTWHRGGRNYPATIPWIRANGGEVVDADVTKSLVDEPPAREALEWLFAQRDTHAVWPPADAVSGDELFKVGRVAMLYAARSFTGQLLVPQAEYGLKYGVAAAPHGPVKPVNWLFSQVVISSGRCDQRAGRVLDLPQLVGGGGSPAGLPARNSPQGPGAAAEHAATGAPLGRAVGGPLFWRRRNRGGVGARARSAAASGAGDSCLQAFDEPGWRRCGQARRRWRWRRRRLPRRRTRFWQGRLDLSPGPFPAGKGRPVGASDYGWRGNDGSGPPAAAGGEGNHKGCPYTGRHRPGFPPVETFA